MPWFSCILFIFIFSHFHYSLLGIGICLIFYYLFCFVFQVITLAGFILKSSIFKKRICSSWICNWKMKQLFLPAKFRNRSKIMQGLIIFIFICLFVFFPNSASTHLHSLLHAQSRWFCSYFVQSACLRNIWVGLHFDNQNYLCTVYCPLYVLY